MIYLATPYTSKYPHTEQHRFEQACRAWAICSMRGIPAVSAIVMGHTCLQYTNKRGTWEDWQVIDRGLIRAAKEVWVIKINGWDTSKGVAAEVDYAERNRIPVRYYTLEDLKITPA